MPTALISVKDGYADVWADQFVALYAKALKSPPRVARGGTVVATPPRFNEMMSAHPSPDDVIAVVQRAAKKAGIGGTLVFNVGHGASGGTALDGTVDLAPGKAFTLGGLNATHGSVFVSVFYDVDSDGPGPRMSDLANDEKFNKQSSRLARWATYQKLCKVIADAKLRKVILLTCRVGNSTDFVKKIAQDWGTVVEAYRRRVVLAPQPGGRMRIHLEGDAPGQFTNVSDSEEHLFTHRAPAADVVLVGPPLR